MFFTMSSDGSLVYWSHKTNHYSTHCRNNDNLIFKEEGLAVSLGDERRRHRSLETTHSSSSNHRGRGYSSFETIYYYYQLKMDKD